MADALADYHFLESGNDEDAEPKGNGMAGDGLTAFEEYRGFLGRGAECFSRRGIVASPNPRMGRRAHSDDPASQEPFRPHACSWARQIVRRGQQNSGNFDCPIRYSWGDYYEAPGSTAVYRWTDDVTGPGPGPMRVDAWEGNLLKYQLELDRLGTGKLCATADGTEINAADRGNLNHAGNAGRDKACVEYVVVNDVAARGVP
jgi:hypothetical protein